MGKKWMAFFVKMCKTLLTTVKNDFSKNARAKFFSSKRHVNVLNGMACTLIASCALFYTYEGQFDSVVWRVALNTFVTFWLCYLYGLAIDMVQGEKQDNSDTRFTSYGALPGNVLVLLLWLKEANAYMLYVGLALVVLAYLLWRPKKK